MASDWKSVKAVSEFARERETLKYYPSLLSAARYIDNVQAIPTSELVSCAHTGLTALAQLGACQTGAARSLISLFDQNHQHVVTEATPTLPLVPSLRNEDQEDKLWFCGTAIPRKQAVCDYTLCASEPTEPDGNSSTGELPLTKTEDLATDARFSSRYYAQAGGAVRFYAAVPIRTRRGINIGVFCVLNPVPLDAWSDRHTQIMRNISRTIMEQLEAERLANAQRRNVRMTRGMGSFIEGKATMSGWQHGPNPTAFEDNIKFEGALNANQQVIQDRRDYLENSATSGLRSGDAPSLPRLPSENKLGPEEITIPASDAPAQNDTMVNEEETDDGVDSFGPDTTINEIFSKAANIIRESVEVEGCLFLDATMGSFGALNNRPGGDDSALSTSQSSSSDEDSAASGAKPAGHPCQVLGYSTTESSSIDGADPLKRHVVMPQKLLSALLRRYPSGKIFNFDRTGELQSSDSSGEDYHTRTPTSVAKAIAQGDVSGMDPGNSPRQKNSSKPWSRQAEGRSILGVFQGARSVAFVPVWDLRKERWSAGAFVYTYSQTRILSVEGELSFLRAFGILAMAEALRLDTALADKAKSDALSSLSHELRSPLHGIVLSVELIEDTQLDVFQGNVAHTIETCCRTLIDTVDHLLDFSKINNMMGKRVQQRQNSFARGLRGRSTKSMEAGMTSLYSFVRLDSLAEEVIESVFTGFNFQHISISQLAKESKESRVDVDANRRMDAMRAMEDLEPSRTTTGELQVQLGNVSVLFWIDPSCSWTFYAQPGAIRRIIMNLFGNALKYTTKGIVKVMLKQTTLKSKNGNNERMVHITVADTGKGISQDYLRNGLFKPFSQEDHLAPGTGLGLSLVKNLTTRLQGRISVKSQVGVGTIISVMLPLELMPISSAVQEPSLEDDQRFRKQVQELRGLRISLRGFDVWGSPTEARDASAGEINGRTQVESICRDWLHMEIVSPSQAELFAPDLILWSEDEFQRSAESAEAHPVAPCIVMCSNALTAYQQTMSFDARGKRGVYEFISQPLAPRKLAKAFTLTFQQWLSRQAESPSTENSPQYTALNDPDSLPIRSISADSSLASNGLHTPTDSLTTNSRRTPSPSKSDATAASTPPHHDGVTASSRPSSEGSPTPAEPRSFLLVDDNHINLKILVSYMKSLGRPYQTATNGLEAVETYLRDPDQFICILMDISMPVMDGFTATRRIRDFEAENKLNAVSIFALSGLASTEAQQEAFGSGINLFLTKPVKLKELGSILRSRKIMQ